MNIPDTTDKYMLEEGELTSDYYKEVERRAKLLGSEFNISTLGTSASGCLREESWHISFIHKLDYSFASGWSRFTNQRYSIVVDGQDVIDMTEVDNATLEMVLGDLHEETQWIDNIKQPNLDDYIAEEISRYWSGL